MNLVQKGCLRDREILRLVETHQALNTEQIAALLFPGKYGLTKARQRLYKLHQSNRLNRFRPSFDTPCAYFLGRKSGQLEHLVAVNWVYVWFKTRLNPSWETAICWERERDYGILRADAFYGIHNSVTGENRFWFVELDRSANAWDKVSKYNELYASGAYMARWWAKKTRRFPVILCVTETEKRALTIQEAIQKENANGLEFQVKLLSQIRKEVEVKCCRR